MKIVFLTTGLLTGGAEEMLFKLLSRLDRKSFDPTVISLLANGPVRSRIEELGVPVYPIGMRAGLPGPIATLRLLKLLRRLQPDLVQGWMYHGNLAASLGVRYCGHSAPVLWNIRHSLYDIHEVRPLTGLVIKACAKQSSQTARIIYCADVSRMQHEACGYDRTKSIVIPNGFDVARYSPSATAPGKLREELSLSSSVLLVGNVGRFHAQKNHLGFLESARIVVDEWVRGRSEDGCPIHFVLAGRGVDSDNSTLIDAISRLGLTGRVHLLGERSDIPDIMAGLDLLVSSSSFGEAFPNVIGEAMSCGVPCVVTNIGDSAKILGGLGIVVPPNEPRHLAAGICDLLHRPPAERVLIGKESRSRVVAEYSLSAVTALYERTYRELVELSPSSSERALKEG